MRFSRLNPYSNGIQSATGKTRPEILNAIGLNPYSNGIQSATAKFISHRYADY